MSRKEEGRIGKEGSERMKIKSGNIFVYYTFDVASEILLDKLEKILGKKPIEQKLEHSRITPKYIQYAQPPLLVNFGARSLQLGKRKFDFKVVAKLYDFGVITIRFEMSFTGSFDELEKVSNLLSENDELEKEALKYAEKIKREIAGQMVRPLEIIEASEDYVIFYVKEFEKKILAKDVLGQSAHIARIIRAEGEELSKSEIAATISSPISYFTDDLVIADWHAAFVYDPRETWDTFDVLEYANIELLQLRVYDALLDKEIEKAYDELSKRKFVISLDPYASVLRRIEEVKLDVTQIIEKVENALKLVGDPYLAKVYTRVSQAFHTNEWKASIERKLDIIESLYATLNARTQTVRFIILELLVLSLIVFEIVTTFWPY